VGLERPSSALRGNRNTGVASTECAAIARRRRAFSLIELLTVIGIVSILIAILLPAMTRAREQANQTKCIATLRSIGMAAQMHATDHRGYLPTAGWQWSCVGGVCDARGLEDEAERKYEYYTDAGVKRPAPTTVALAKYLGVTCRTDSREALEQDMAGDELRKLFRCPSQLMEDLGWTQRGDEGGTWTSPEEFSSYVFNEALLGRTRKRQGQSANGKLSRVTASSQVLLAMDGRIRDQQSNRYLLVCDPEDEHSGDATLLEFHHYTMISEPNIGRELLDFARHRLRACAVFVDGHAASFPIGVPPEGGEGLSEVYVSRGIAPR
jgi:prepilin-type N-terminal cleavage/methylation domain-containing protein